MNKKMTFKTVTYVSMLLYSVTLLAMDPRSTRQITVDIDTTLTICCANTEVNFEGTFTTNANLTALVKTADCSSQLLTQADIGTTGYTIVTPGVYKLTENISFNPLGSAAAITINADEVVLDLQCYSISQGNGTANVDGIAIAANHSAISIYSGSLRNFTRNGIRVESGNTNLAYADITIQNCLYGIFCLGTDLLPIEILHARGLDLISNSTAVSFNFVNRAAITEISCLDNTHAGIELINSFSNNITYCTIENTAAQSGSAFGISMIQGGDNRVQSCYINGVSTNDTFSGNSAVGILLGESEINDKILNNQISNCTTTSNAQPFGIEMLYSFTALSNSGLPPYRSFVNQASDWNSNGRFLVATNGNLLSVFEYNGSALRLLDTTDGKGQWFPNSSLIAYNSDTPSTLSILLFDGVVVSADTTISTYIFDNPPGISPNGKYVAGARFENFTTPIRRVTIIGYGRETEQIRLITTRTVSTIVGPTIPYIRWSPDSNYIVFALDTTIFVYAFDGASLTLAAQFPTSAIAQVDWSPDGQYIAYDDGTLVSVLKFTGSSLIPVTPPFDHGATTRIIRWSPDSEYIVFGANPEPITNINIRVLKFNKTYLTVAANFVAPGGNVTTDRWTDQGNIISFGSTIIGLLTGFQFPAGSVIKGNEVSNIRGPLLPSGQPGFSSGRGISASSGNNLILKNSCFDNDIDYVFANNVFQSLIENVDFPNPTTISNLSFSPLN